MRSDKILYIQQCCFNLPDNFEGTLGEALNLLAQYRLQQEKFGSINHLTVTNESDCYDDVINDNSIKCSMVCGLLKLSQDGSSWERM